MDRRDFLRGTLLATTAAASTALVQLASAEDVQRLTTGAPVMMGQPSLEPMVHSAMGRLVFVETPKGFEPIGVLTRIEASRQMIDGTTAWNGTAQYLPGLSTAWFHFEGSK